MTETYCNMYKYQDATSTVETEIKTGDGIRLSLKVTIKNKDW